jgi:hypothetical protein
MSDLPREIHVYTLHKEFCMQIWEGVTSSSKFTHELLIKSPWLRLFPKRSLRCSFLGVGKEWQLPAKPWTHCLLIRFYFILTFTPKTETWQKSYSARKYFPGWILWFLWDQPLTLPWREIILYELTWLTTLAPFATMNNVSRQKVDIFMEKFYHLWSKIANFFLSL